MIAYIIMYCAVLFGVFNHKSTKTGYFVWAVLLFFSVFRGENVGTDTQNYTSFEYSAFRAEKGFEVTSSSSMEVLTNAIFRIVESGANPRIIISFFSVVTFVFLLLLSKRAKINLSFLMMVFLLGGGYIYSFNIARQWAAIAVAAYAITYVYETNFKRSLLFFPFIVLAGSIHFVAIFYSVTFLFRFIKLKYPIAIIALISGFVLSLFVNFNLNGSVLGVFGSYLETYGDLMSVKEERNLMGRIVSLYFIALYAFMMVKMDKIGIGYLIPIMLICTLIGLFTNQMDSIIRRFFMFFNFINSVVLAKYFSSDKSHQLLLCAYLVIATYLFFSSGINDLYTFTFDIF